MVKRNMFLFLVVILMVTSFSTGSLASKYEFTMGYHVPRSHLLGDVVQKFAEFVEEETNGEATLKIFPARELGDQRELVDGMIIGTIDMSINSTDYLSSVIPEMGIFDLPFLWNDYDHLEKAITGNPGNKLKELMIEKSGIRPLDFLFTDFRKFYLTRKIDSFRELKSMDIRVPEAKVYIDTIVALDANPHAIPGGDIITSLNTGLIQGYEGEPASAYTSGFAAAARNSLETNHIFTAIVLNMSNKVYENLPEDIQKGINRAAERAGKWGRAYAIEVETDFYQKIKDEMLETVTTVSDADKEELKLITKPIHKELLDSVNINDIYEEIVSLGKK